MVGGLTGWSWGSAARSVARGEEFWSASGTATTRRPNKGGRSVRERISRLKDVTRSVMLLMRVSASSHNSKQVDVQRWKGSYV